MKSGLPTGQLKKITGSKPAKAAARKIVSRTGASITFALLIFLVCAVVGSVILVAGTSAAGRLAKMAEYDQRYYSVASVAEILADTVESGYSVTIEQNHYVKETEIARYKIEGKTGYVYTLENETGLVLKREMIPSGEPVDTYSYYISGSDDSVSPPVPLVTVSKGQSLLRDAAIDLVFNLDKNYNYANPNDGTPYSKGFPTALTEDKTQYLTITHTVKSGDLTADTLSVDAVMTILSNGDISLKLSNSNGPASEKYELTMILKAIVEQSTSDNTDVVGQGTDRVETTTTSTKITTITWTVGDVY